MHVMLSISLHRWSPSSAGGGRKPLSHLHGRHHRLRVAWMRPHGDLHQMRKEDERVPHLQAVRGAGRACLQVLKLNLFSFRCVGAHVALDLARRRNLMLQQLWKNFFFSRLRLLPLAYISPLRPTCPPAAPGLPLCTADTDTTLCFKSLLVGGKRRWFCGRFETVCGDRFEIPGF